MKVMGDYPRGYKEGIRVSGRWEGIRVNQREPGDVIRIDGIRYTVIEHDRGQFLLDRPLDDMICHGMDVVWVDRVSGGFGRWV